MAIGLFVAGGVSDGFLEAAGEDGWESLANRAVAAEEKMDRAQADCMEIDVDLGVAAAAGGFRVGTPTIESGPPPTDQVASGIDVERSVFDPEAARRLVGLTADQLHQMEGSGAAHRTVPTADGTGTQYSYDELLDLAWAKYLWRTRGLALDEVRDSLSRGRAREALELEQPVELDDGSRYDLHRMKADLDAAILEAAR